MISAHMDYLKIALLIVLTVLLITRISNMQKTTLGYALILMMCGWVLERLSWIPINVIRSLGHDDLVGELAQYRDYTIPIQALIILAILAALYLYMSTWERRIKTIIAIICLYACAYLFAVYSSEYVLGWYTL